MVYGIIFKYRLLFAILGSMALLGWGFFESAESDVWVFFALALLLPFTTAVIFLSIFCKHK